MEFLEIFQNKKASFQSGSPKKSFTTGKISFRINLDESHEKKTENGSNRNSSIFMCFLL